MTKRIPTAILISGRGSNMMSLVEAARSAHYPADVPHSIENTGADDAVLFLVVTYVRD